ncbi:hypothetical protein ACFPRL_27285 [Pseudoclavibacter helvolus]
MAPGTVSGNQTNRMVSHSLVLRYANLIQARSNFSAVTRTV